MKYHIVSGDSAAGSLKYYFKLNNIEDVIINHSDNLSVWPINVDFQEKYLWMKEKLYPWDNVKDTEEICNYILNNQNRNLEYINNFTKEDSIIIWYGDNVIENLMLYKICNLINKWKIYIINVSKYKNENWYFLKAVWECSPDDIWMIIDNWIFLAQDKKIILSNYYEDMLNKKSYLRILDNWVVKNVNEDYYDDDLLKYIPNNIFISSWRAIWDVMWYSNQVIWDDFLQYRLKYLIDNNYVSTYGKIDSMRYFKIKKII